MSRVTGSLLWERNTPTSGQIFSSPDAFDALGEHCERGGVATFDPGALTDADIAASADEEEGVGAVEGELVHQDGGQSFDGFADRVVEGGTLSGRDPGLVRLDPGTRRRGA